MCRNMRIEEMAMVIQLYPLIKLLAIGGMWNKNLKPMTKIRKDGLHAKIGGRKKTVMLSYPSYTS